MLANLGKNGAFVDNEYADDARAGDRIADRDDVSERHEDDVRDEGHLRSADRWLAVRVVTISTTAWDEQVPNPQNLYSFVTMKGDVTDANTAALERTLDGFPNAKVQTREQFIDNQISGLSSVLNILYVLLALSIVVSIFGIVNTLVLTVFERTREIGMLRAIGMTRRQIRRMIRHESVITALIGASIGIVLGVVLAALLDRTSRLHRLRVPDDADHRVRDRRGHRRHRRGDLPGPPGCQARSARSHLVRVRLSPADQPSLTTPSAASAAISASA